MAKVTFRAKEEDLEKVGEDTEFVEPKPGFYHAKIVEATPGFSKKKDSDDEDPKKPRIEVVYEIIGEGMENKETTATYGRLWDWVTFGDGYAGTRRVEFAMALDSSLSKEQVAKGVDFDTDEMVERIVIIRVKSEKDKRKSLEEKKTVTRARVASVMALDAADGYTATEFSGDAFAGAEDPDDEPEGNPFADEPAAEEPAAEDGLLTEKELDGYDMKELGATATEFDLEVPSFVVRFKSGEKKGTVNAAASKKAIIAGILEAQGSNEDPAPAEGEDDSPF